MSFPQLKGLALHTAYSTLGGIAVAVAIHTILLAFRTIKES